MTSAAQRWLGFRARSRDEGPAVNFAETGVIGAEPRGMFCVEVKGRIFDVKENLRRQGWRSGGKERKGGISVDVRKFE